ncbi:MAG: TIGR04283 family arsenosugar biosynthesis glycosyltransferase [Hyphomicrobiales bacterium]|nr:TIGR04283 family arsenosugar biosynthesis glycosyltransferase [Hyphomicrobiales bacterium]
MKLSVVMPVLNERTGVSRRLAELAPLRAQGVEVIVVDGSSSDGTAEAAARLADRVLVAPRGRASQMNAGAGAASGELLLFLHADTRLPLDAARLISCGLRASGRAWGRFDVRIEGAHPLLPVVARLMNLRSRYTGVATGDQAMFVRADAFAKVGGFPDIALMEDIAISRRLKRLSSPLCLRACVATSGRRWDEKGFWKTVLLMWRLRLAFFLGADPNDLARAYGYRPREN